MMTSSPDVLEEIHGVVCPSCGTCMAPGTTVDGAFVHMLAFHPKRAAKLIARFPSAETVAWALDIPEALR